MRVFSVVGSPLESIAFFNFLDGYFWDAVIVVACGAPVPMSGFVFVVLLGVDFWCDAGGKAFIWVGVWLLEWWYQVGMDRET